MSDVTRRIVEDDRELPYAESCIRYQGIAHHIAMASDEDGILFCIALARLAKQQEEESK